MNTRTTRTFAKLEVPKALYDLVAEKLRAAGYEHAFVDDAIDMHGLALTIDESSPAVIPTQSSRGPTSGGQAEAAPPAAEAVAVPRELIPRVKMLLGHFMATMVANGEELPEDLKSFGVEALNSYTESMTEETEGLIRNTIAMLSAAPSALAVQAGQESANALTSAAAAGFRRGIEAGRAMAADEATLAPAAAAPVEWGQAVRYLTDDRDSRQRHELIIAQGGNGDWYVSVLPEGDFIGPTVRLCTSGGASSRVPGLTIAISQAYRALRGEPTTRPVPAAPIRAPNEDELLGMVQRLHYVSRDSVEEVWRYVSKQLGFPPNLWRIRHSDGVRYRTMDSIGCPDWTTDPEKALTTTLREHVERYSEDDPEDVRIIEVQPGAANG